MTAITNDVVTVAGLVAGLEERLALAQDTRDRAQAAATAATDAGRTAERQRDALAQAIGEVLRPPSRVPQVVTDQLLGACLQAGVLDRVLREIAI